MGKKDKCCDRYKKKDKYCSGCPIVDSCELAPRPGGGDDTGKRDSRRGRPPCRPEEEASKQAKKEKKEKKERKQGKEKKEKKDKKEKKVKKDKKGRKDKKDKKEK